MRTPAAEFRSASARAAADTTRRAIVARAIATYDAKVAERKDGYVDWARGRERLRDVKAAAVARLADLLEEFERNASARGTIVHWAEDAAAARQIILDIARRRGVTTVVKSKSMVTEEIALNAFLEKNGVTPIETDLGEFIVQLRGETPYHIVTPVMHLTREEVDRTFQEKLGTPPGGSAEELAMTARRVLREKFITAGMGIIGCNFIVADAGMVSMTENEGNGRLSAGIPPVHVAITGIEKVIPHLSDLAIFLPMLAVAGTGQEISCYNTLYGGPRRADEADGPEEFHVILLDNGRTRLLADAAAREALFCIRCGACLNACPVFRTIGGHAYATVYMGPIGSVITPHLRGFPDWRHLPTASTLCGACAESCPVGIDLPGLILHNRRKGGVGFKDRVTFALWGGAVGSPGRFRAAAALARFGQNALRALGLEGTWLDPARAWSGTRKCPTLARQSFRAWWKSRKHVPRNHEEENTRRENTKQNSDITGTRNEETNHHGNTEGTR
ncbi:MAG: lactate utilization protein B [Planctomycetota bacterium]